MTNCIYIYLRFSLKPPQHESKEIKKLQAHKHKEWARRVQCTRDVSTLRKLGAGRGAVTDVPEQTKLKHKRGMGAAAGKAPGPGGEGTRDASRQERGWGWKTGST